MVAKMAEKCSSDEQFLTAAVSSGSITNQTKLPLTYSPEDYQRIPHAIFGPSATVFFLTGGTRNGASGILFKNLLKRGSGEKGKAKKEPSGRSSLLFKAANWVVQLYDFGK